MKQIIYISIVISFFLWQKSNAQDQAVYTQYMINPVLINPAATGYSGDHELFLNYRNQWSSIDGAPRNYTVSYNGRVGDRIGLGVMANAESFGATRRYRALLSYAYQIEAENYTLGLGLSTEFHQFGLSGGTLINQSLDINDVILQQAADGAQYFDVSIGAFGSFGENFIYGLSFPNLVRARLDESFLDEESESTSFRYFTLMTGYKLHARKYDMTFFPSIVLKRVFRGPEDIHADLNFLVSFLNDQLTGGISYQIGGSDRLGFIVGTKLDQFNFYYSYDSSFNPLQEYSNGSHELTIGFVIKPITQKDVE